MQITEFKTGCCLLSVPGSRRRATKNHKSKAELLNPEEGEGDLAVGETAHTHAHAHKAKPPVQNIQMLACLDQHHLTRPTLFLLHSFIQPNFGRVILLSGSEFVTSDIHSYR